MADLGRVQADVADALEPIGDADIDRVAVVHPDDAAFEQHTAGAARPCREDREHEEHEPDAGGVNHAGTVAGCRWSVNVPASIHASRGVSGAPSESATCAPGLALELEEELLVPDVGRYGHDLGIASAH